MNDVLALLNGAYRVFQGQVPHLDFHSLYGPFVFYIPALGLRAGLEPSAIFAFDGVVVAAFVLLAGGLTMYRRFPLPISLTTLVFLWLLIVVPMASGKGFQDISWGTFYNRHGWAALAVVMLFYVEPEDKKRYDKWLDSIILASLAVFLLYTKITFGLVSVAFITANMVTSSYSRFVSCISIIIIIVAIALTEVAFEFHGEYLANILVTGANNSILRGGFWGLLGKLIAHAWVFVACAGAILVTLAAGRRSFLDWAYVLGAIVASMMLLETTGGSSGKGLPSLIAVFVCCGELARRAEIGREVSGTYNGWRNHAGSVACLFLVLMFISEPVSNRVIAWHDHYLKTTRNALKPLPGLPPALSGFLVQVEPGKLLDTLGHDEDAHNFLARGRHIFGNTLSPHEYLLTIIEGVELLRTTELRDRTLFVLDNADPFTVALNMKPTENGYPLLWANSMLKSHPQGQEMFYGVDFVLVPILPHEPTTFEILTDIYGDYLDREFVEFRRSPHWRLLARKSRHNPTLRGPEKRSGNPAANRFFAWP